MNNNKVMTCIGYSQNGHGIVDVKGKHVEVPNLIKGEQALIKIVKRKGFTSGAVVSRKRTAKARVKPPCQYFERCGGCQIQHLSNDEQRNFKQKLVYKSLKSFGKIKPIEMMTDATGYRNKCVHTFARNKKGKIIAGLYQNYSHRVIAIERCYIHDQRADAIANSLRDLMEKLNIEPYDEDRKTGDIRHLLTRVAKGTGQVLLTIVTGTANLPQRDKLIAALVKAHPEIDGIVQNINGKKTSLVLSRRQKLLYGKAEIVDTLCEKQFKISAQSFYQINRSQTEKIYRYALKLANIKRHERILDAYCGIGTISLLLADKAKSVVGVEVNPAAVANAKENAMLNDVKNVSFVAQDAGEYLKAQKRGSFDGVVLDPPREGCNKVLIDSLIQHSPSKIVYISCNPETQARDIKQLKRAGYRVKDIKPFDMFVFTSHVECVALLTRK